MTEDVSLPGNMTIVRLRQITPEDRFRIRENARHSRLYPLADRLKYVEIIDSTGPCIDRSGITNDEPLSLAMYDIINSEKGKAACVAATSAGLPALAGVEPLIVAELGSKYSERYMATVQAGSLVGAMMQLAGYKKSKSMPMPEGSVAKNAASWKRHR